MATEAPPAPSVPDNALPVSPTVAPTAVPVSTPPNAPDSGASHPGSILDNAVEPGIEKAAPDAPTVPEQYEFTAPEVGGKPVEIDPEGLASFQAAAKDAGLTQAQFQALGVHGANVVAAKIVKTTLGIAVPMVQHPGRWDPSALSFDMADELTADPVVTVVVNTPQGVLSFIAEARLQGRTLTLRGTHMQGAARNAVGAANLRILAQTVVQRMNLDGLVVEGAVRTSGANPGRRPSALRFSRPVRPAVAGPGDTAND